MAHRAIPGERSGSVVFGLKRTSAAFYEYTA